jgi:hypothetical protein
VSQTYNNGVTNAGNLTSPAINLIDAVHPVLIYREWREVEDMPIGVDRSQVQISTNGFVWTTLQESDLTTAVVPVNWQERAAIFGWSRPFFSEFSTPQWISRSADLSAYVGKTINIRFRFDIKDKLYNDFEGWYVDDVMVFDQAAPLPMGNPKAPANNKGIKIAIGDSVVTSRRPPRQADVALPGQRNRAASTLPQRPSLIAATGAEPEWAFFTEALQTDVIAR